MKIFQVVFLLDLDSIFQVSAAEDSVFSKTKAVREVLLKFLTFFATQHCDSAHNASFNLKWDCKYYMSSVNKSIRQRCSFKDFNLENYEKFENELEDRIKKHKIEQQQSLIEPSATYDLDSASNQNDNTQSKPVSFCQGDNKLSLKTRIRNLELALKDLSCDYTWDQLYVCSPVRKERRLQQNEETKRKSIENDGVGEVENVVMVITSVPSSLSQLDGLAEGKRKLTQQVLLDNILPQSLYKKFVQTSKIRLFLLDTSDTVYCDSESKIGLSETRAIYDLFHRALQKTGGGFIPLNAILPTCHINNNDPLEKAKCIPAGLEFQIPVANLMSGYLSGGKGIEDIKTQAQKCSRLHLNLGAKESKPVTCNLELLPLFRSNITFSENSAKLSEKCKSLRISCTNKAEKVKSASNMKTTSPVKQFKVTCKEETDVNYIPQDIRIIGTLHLSEIHRQLIAKPLVYICCSMDQTTANNQSNTDPLSLRQILTELATQQIALLVLCDDLSQGVFFPSNSRCEIALLYVLVSEGEASVFTLKAPPTSIPKDINSFIQKSLETFKKLSPKKRTTTKTNSKQDDVAIPSTFLETWFIPHPFYKSTLSEMKPTRHSPPSTVQKSQKAILRNLQKAYLPSLMNTKLKETSSNSIDSIPNSDRLRCSPRLKRDSRLNANIPVSKKIPQSSSNQKGIATNNHEQHSRIKKRTSILSDDQMSTSAGICAQDDENTMLTNLTAVYKNAIFGDSAVISIAQTVLDVCYAFYKNQDRINAKMCTRDLISKHFLLKSGDVESSNGTKEEAKKWKIREHCFQSIIRMELLGIDPSNTEEYVTQTISHLRKLPFIAGPSMLSSFLQETIVENYYNQFKEAVTEICEELNQPLPDEDADLSSSSYNDILLSPEKPDSIPTSVISQMSIISSISSNSNQSRPLKARRSEVVTRFPSFGDVVHKRKIIISQGNSKMTSNTGPLTRSAQKRSKEKLTGTKSVPRNVCRSLFEQGIPATKKYATPPKHHKPTTPNGRHVLRTKNVADTPVHKQVDQPTLRRQSLKRKRTLELDNEEDEVVEESPDKQEAMSFNASFNARRTPKRHSSTLRRKASFYSSQPEPKTEPAMVDSINIVSSKTPLRRSARKPVQIVSPKTSPDKKLKAKRVLILSDTPERSMRKISPKKAFKGNSSAFSPRRSGRLAGLEDEHKMRTPTRLANTSSPRLCGKQEMKRTPTGSCRKSQRLSKSFVLDLKDSATSEIDHLPHHPFAKCKARDMTKNPNVSRKLLQTPLKSESKPASRTPAKRLSPSKIYKEERVPSTPTKNGIESPNASPTHAFLYGPLAKDFDCLSRSSSPIIPLLSYEMAEFYEDENQCASSEAKFGGTSSENCDGFRSCQDMEVNFGQYFSTIDAQTTVGGILQDATVPSDSLTQENTSFMFTPTKTYERDIGSPKCTLWELQKGFNSVIGRLTNHTHSFEDTERPKTRSHETIQFSPKPGTASEENMPKTKHSSAYSDCYSLQRFTRQASKEIGISLKEFKKLTSEIGHSETSKDCKTPEKKWNSSGKLSNAPKTNSSSSPKFSRPIVKAKFTSPSSKSIFHLTNSPILSSISSRTTRHSLKNQMKNGSKDKQV